MITEPGSLQNLVGEALPGMAWEEWSAPSIVHQESVGLPLWLQSAVSGGSGQTPRFRFFIAGNERSDYLRITGLDVSRRLRAADTMQFSLIDVAGVYRPDTGDRVLYLDNGVTRYDGMVAVKAEEFTNPTDTPTSAGTILHECSSHSWAIRLAQIIHVRNYPADEFGTLSSILTSLAAEKLTPEGIALSYTGPTVTDLGDIQARGTLEQFLNLLADLAAGEWKVDFTRTLHFFDPAAGVGVAPYSVADDAGRFRTLKVTKDANRYANVVYVQGDTGTGGVVTESFTVAVGDLKPVWTFRNDPSPRPGYTNPRTLDTKDAAVDMISDFGSVVLRSDWSNPEVAQPWAWAYFPPTGELPNSIMYNPSFPDLTVGQIVTFTFPVAARVPQLYVAENVAEIAARQAAEGAGTGRHEILYTVSGVSDPDVLQQLANSLLERHGVHGIPQTLEMETDDVGYDPGQRVTFSTTKPLAAGSYLVESIRSKEIAAGPLNTRLRSTLTLQRDLGIGDIIRQAQRRAEKDQKGYTQQIVLKFIIAKTIYNLDNPGLIAGTNVTGVTARAPRPGVLKLASIHFTDDKPTLSNVKVDIRRQRANGVPVSIFSLEQLTYKVGDTVPQMIRKFSTANFKVQTDDLFILDVIVGDTTALDGLVELEYYG